MGMKRGRESDTSEKAPEGCYHYDDLAEVPWDIQRYVAAGCLIMSMKKFKCSSSSGTIISVIASFQSMTRASG